MNIGRKIYWDLLTGEILVDTGEKFGSVTTTTLEEDILRYKVLAERNPSTFDVIQLEPNQYNSDFRECISYRVNQSTRQIEFSYPNKDETDGDISYQPSLSTMVKEIEEKLKAKLASLEQSAMETSTTQQELLELLIDLGVI